MRECSWITFFVFFCLALQGQDIGKNKVFVTGIVCDRDSVGVLPDAVYRWGREIRGVDSKGCFAMEVHVGDTLRFSHIGYMPMEIIIADSLKGNDFLLGIFMVRDTIMLAEVLILPRFFSGEYVSNANLQNAYNNFNRALHAASQPVKVMDREMNRRMVLEDFARKVEMKGMVDVKLGVGTQSLVALRGLLRTRRQAERGEVINGDEIDLLRKIFYTEKKEKADN